MKKTFSVLMATLTILGGANLSSVSATLDNVEIERQINQELDQEIRTFATDLHHFPWFNMELLDAAFNITDQNANIIDEANTRSRSGFYRYLQELLIDEQIHNRFIQEIYMYSQADVISHIQEILQLFNRTFREFWTQRSVQISEIKARARRAV